MGESRHEDFNDLKQVGELIRETGWTVREVAGLHKKENAKKCITFNLSTAFEFDVNS